jgi:cyclopropane-fatty-acyl-phospholipid synthase
MPSEDLFLFFQSKLKLQEKWQVNGTPQFIDTPSTCHVLVFIGQHYGKTCRDWLDLTDTHKTRVLELFAETYGKAEALKWFAMWRVFYMSCEECFNYNNGEEWYVTHYLFQRPEEA